MDAVWIDVPEDFLAERARLGHDRKDELWEGVLHLVSPTASTLHGLVAFELCKALSEVAPRLGLAAFPDGVGIYAPESNPASWRVPDASLARPDQVFERGLDGAVLAIEVLSPGDESRQKLGFYFRVGLAEVWLVEPKTREIEIFVRGEHGFSLLPPVDAGHRSPLLGLTARAIAGPKLELSGDGYVVEI